MRGSRKVRYPPEEGGVYANREQWAEIRRRVLVEGVSRAYERTSLIRTTNLPFEQWTDVLGSERRTGRCSIV